MKIFKGFKLIFSRLFLVGLAVILQVTLLSYFIFDLTQSYFYFQVSEAIFGFLAFIAINNSKKIHPEHKILWVILLLVIPFVGITLYILFMINTPSKKIIKKYRDMSVEMKAASWYAVGNIIQKIAPWLVMIILTHYLATEEYGIYSIFMSWLEIFEIIITLRIYSNGYVAGLVRDDENRTTYTATMQSLSIVLIVIWTLMYLMFHKGINYITGISTPLSILMICSFIGTISFGLWS